MRDLPCDEEGLVNPKTGQDVWHCKEHMVKIKNQRVGIRTRLRLACHVLKGYPLVYKISFEAGTMYLPPHSNLHSCVIMGTTLLPCPPNVNIDTEFLLK